MSLGFTSARPKVNDSSRLIAKDGNFGVVDAMKYGLAASKPKSGACHPLELTERNYASQRDLIEFNILRNTQGLHAPLRLQMERNAVAKVGRLPFLASARPSLDVLLGRDEEIGFEDILNTHEFREPAGQPHAVVENQLGIL